MNQGICLLSVVPMRSMPDDKSEMISQLLFGDWVHILEKRDKWLFVQNHSDRYQGWVSSGQLSPLENETFNELQDQPQWVSNDLVQILENKTQNFSFIVTAGSSFYNCKDKEFELCGDTWQYHGEIIKAGEFDSSHILDHALLFLHSPYLWGGKSALGMDCSGFTQLVYKMAGRHIHRDASQQASQGEMINLVHEALPGDLLFFDNEEGSITHVGIMIDEQHIIHAHQKVRIDKIDHHGIFNVDTRKYTHQLRLIKRHS